MAFSDLKYNTVEEVEKAELKLTESESKIFQVLNIEHNTIDLINQNLKLKEHVRFVQARYMSDV